MVCSGWIVDMLQRSKTFHGNMMIDKYKVRQNPGWTRDDQVLAWLVV